jgi:hypothetical protein
MTTLFSLIPLVLCAGMMFGAGIAVWFATRTPLRRVPWIARHARRSAAQPDAGSRA